MRGTLIGTVQKSIAPHRGTGRCRRKRGRHTSFRGRRFPGYLEGVGPAPDARDDQTLIAAINAGDAGAFDALYYRYRDWVVTLAYRFTHHHDDALDVLQETFSYLLRKTPGLKLTARMTTFLYPVVKNLSIAARKKRGRFVGDDPETLDQLPANPEQASSRPELAAILSSLPPGQQEVLLLRFVDGFSLEEVAGALSIPLGTVKSRLHNALEALRKDPRAQDYFKPQ